MMYNGGEFLLSGDLCIDDILSLVQGNSLATDDPGNIHPGQKADDQDNVLCPGGSIGICVHKTRRLEKELVPIPVKLMQFGLFLNLE